MVLACNHIKKEFSEQIILNDASFHINESDRVAIVGINGAGKTTLLRIIVGEINADEARVHPDKNIITRAVGTSDHVEADFFEVEITADDTILLCTDGLTNMVRDDEILDIIKKYDNAQAATMQLVKEANANGGRDNITVMIIKPF